MARAAIQYRNGTTYAVDRPGRHHDVIRLMDRCGVSARATDGAEQGFELDDGRFVGREEAARIAIASGQIERTRWGRELFSEDLW